MTFDERRRLFVLSGNPRRSAAEEAEYAGLKARAETTAPGICDLAANLVGGDREATHGDKHANFKNIADIWTAVLTAKARRDGTHEVFVDPVDVASMLEALKIARRYSGAHNIDDYVDAAGYAGCAGEIAERLNNPKS